MSSCQLCTLTANYKRWSIKGGQRVQKLRSLHVSFSLTFLSLYYVSIKFTRAQAWWKVFAVVKCHRGSRKHTLVSGRPASLRMICALCELGLLYGHWFCCCYRFLHTWSSLCFSSCSYCWSTSVSPGIPNLLTLGHSILYLQSSHSKSGQSSY